MQLDPEIFGQTRSFHSLVFVHPQHNTSEMQELKYQLDADLNISDTAEMLRETFRIYNNFVTQSFHFRGLFILDILVILYRH